MLRSLKDLEHYTVNAAGGDVGNVLNFLFDAEHWVIRYLVVDTGGQLNRLEVLISPASFSEVDWLAQRFYLNLTRDEVNQSPSIDTAKPVSRQQEEDFHNYYGYPPYWDYSEAHAGLAAVDGSTDVAPLISKELGDIHLRSAKEVRGYDVQASDGSIGHVDDFIVEDDIWNVRYLVVDTSNWWFGRKVLVASQWTKRIGWEQGNVYVDMSRQAIKDSPEYDPSVTVNREYETRLYDHYREHGYWNRSERQQRPMRQSGSEFR